MKDTHVFYGICIIAILAIAAVGIGYATDMLPLHKQPAKTKMFATTNATQIGPGDHAAIQKCHSTEREELWLLRRTQSKVRSHHKKAS